jgi:hypothetical protein
MNLCPEPDIATEDYRQGDAGKKSLEWQRLAPMPNSKPMKSGALAQVLFHRPALGLDEGAVIDPQLHQISDKAGATAGPVADDKRA